MFLNVYQMAGEVCSRSWLVLLFLILLALGYCVVSVCQTSWQLFPHLVVQGVWRVTGGARITIANHLVVFYGTVQTSTGGTHLRWSIPFSACGLIFGYSQSRFWMACASICSADALI